MQSLTCQFFIVYLFILIVFMLAERQGFAFFVDLDDENLPNFDRKCMIIGHDISKSKKTKSPFDNIVKN